MKEQVAELLEMHGNCCIEIYDNEYSGRGMYGKTTHAVVCDDAGDICVAIATAAIEEPSAFEGLEPKDFRFREDNIGMQRIFY